LFIGLLNVGMTSFGPRSYEPIVESGQNVSVAWPLLAQDTGILIMIIVAFRLMNWRDAAAVNSIEQDELVCPTIRSKYPRQGR
jgi:hypothetical protein